MADDWLILFELAMDMIDHAETVMGHKIAWTVGGGTMLRQMFSHRHSKDIDIFLNDPQVLLYLSPRTNNIAERVADAGNYQEASNFIKFITSHGEIDFAVAPQLTKPHATSRTLGSTGSYGRNTNRDYGKETVVPSGGVYCSGHI